MLTMDEIRDKYEVKVRRTNMSLVVNRHEVFHFPNGRGASVIDGALHSYPFYSEIAVLKISGRSVKVYGKYVLKDKTNAKGKYSRRVERMKKRQGYLDYTTPLGNDVIVVQNEAAELDILNKIHDLPKRRFIYFTRKNPHKFGEQLSQVFAKVGNIFKGDG